ncbi:autoinducer binding domain-containing protein [Oceaniglobus roseus]|uniref:autoinducer binding domain-containing protein n=1 Tax=Oceaniglobus roseus TaxID=1737570 RepID=UPI0013000085|nr:autoinducer binding domain-containing protein [Kandeliimicrobium roseum]
MSLIDELRLLLTNLKTMAPQGFAAAFHVDFATPKYLFQTYDDAWMTYYSASGLVMKDPAVRWGFSHDGIAPWADLVAMDSHKVFEKAAEYGLHHWCVVATSERGSKSIGAFSRGDAPFSDEEREAVFADFQRLHLLTLQGPESDPGFGKMLHDLSIQHTHRDTE